MGATAAVAGVVVAAGSATYQAHEAKKAEAAAGNVPKPPAAPQLPDTAGLANSLQQSEIAAKTAGGTILSKPGQIGDGGSSTRKTLLGN